MNNILYGENLVTHEPIMCNRADLKHPNCFVFGSAGSGKTEVVKREIRQIIDATDDEIIIFDEAGEYSKLNLGNSSISLEDVVQVNLSSEEKGYHINPMDFVLTEHQCQNRRLLDHAISDKCNVITAIFEQVMRKPLSYAETDIVYNAVKTVLFPFIEELKKQHRNYAPEINPTLEDVMVVLTEKYYSEKIGVAEKSKFLEPVLFGKEKPYFETLKYRTNIPHYKTTEISWHPMPAKLDVIMYIVCIDYAQNKLLLNDRHKTVYMYWDSADSILNRRHDCSGLFLSLLYTSHNYGGMQTLIAQSFDEIFSSASNLFSQFDLFEFLCQSKASREIIQKMYGLNEQKLSYITNALCGTGLFYKVDEGFIPFTIHTKS